MTKTRPYLVKQAAAEIRKANSLVLACHVRPDADALGSLIGMVHGLEQLGKRVAAVSDDGVPVAYRFLPGWDKVRDSAKGSFDLGIGLDCDGSDRMGSAEELVLSAPTVIDIDHHTGPDPFGTVQLVDSTAAATGELVYELLRELGITITPEIAQCLMAAILTDTGAFRFSNVTPNVLRVSADLIEAGAHPSPIYEAVYGARPYGATRLLGTLLGNLERSADGRIVWSGLPYSEFRKLSVDTGATEGFVDQIRMVEGSVVAVFFREEADGDVRVSLRSRNGFNVARVAEEFGGGGHAPAAGCTLRGPLDDAMGQVIGVVKRHMDSGPGALGSDGRSGRARTAEPL